MTKLTKNFKNLYVLGDSLSDEGVLITALSDILNNFPLKNKKTLNISFFKNIKNIENFQYNLKLDNNHFENKSFSDGPTVVRQIANEFNFDLKPAYCKTDIMLFGTKSKLNDRLGNNFAIAGAVSEYYELEIMKSINDFVHYASQPFFVMIKKMFSNLNKECTISKQTNSLIKQHDDLADSLIFICIGGNDLLNLDLIISNKITDERFNECIDYIKKSNQNLKNSILKLIANGAKNIIVFNSIDISLVPRIFNQTDRIKFFYNEIVVKYNNTLKRDIKEINNNIDKKICHLFDLYNCFNNIYSEAVEKKDIVINTGKFKRSIFHFEVDKANKTINIISKVRRTDSNQKNEYLFWDSIHPSKFSHSITAKEIIKFLVNIKFN